jgi:hypothetical protein
MLWEAEVGCWDAHPLFEIEIGTLEIQIVKISFRKKNLGGKTVFRLEN